MLELLAAAIAVPKYDVDKRRFGLYVPEIWNFILKIIQFCMRITANHI